MKETMNRDSMFDRLFFDEIFYLSKSSSKWVSIGVKPLPNGDFVRLLRIVDKHGLMLNFYEAQVNELLASLSEISALKKHLHDDMEFEEEVDIGHEKNVNIEKAGFGGSMVYKLENELSGEKTTLLIIGIKSLQRLYEQRELNYFAFRNLDVVQVKSIFFETVEAVRKLEAKDAAT